jgi:hypothetical protein
MQTGRIAQRCLSIDMIYKVLINLDMIDMPENIVSRRASAAGCTLHELDGDTR